ncbi:MAG: hypothetical protein RR325_04500 [Bacilli bacterium]
MQNYIIPANSKKSQLILGFFTPLDLIIFGTGCSITILLLVILQNANFNQLIIIILPALITGLLVMPVQYYHNVMQLISNMINYFTGRRRYFWKGWCASYDTDSEAK